MRIMWLLSFCLLTITISQGQDYRSPTIWEDEIVIDGFNNEWKQPFGLSNASTGLSFSVANDSAYLYLSFETREPLYILKMLKAGWQLQLSSKERKRRFNTSINFQPMQIEVRPKHDYAGVKNKQKPTFSNWLDDYKLESTTYLAEGFKHASRKTLSIGDPLYHRYIHIGLNYTEEKAVYEIAIPLQELMQEDEINWSEKMKLKVFVNAIENPVRDERSSGSGLGESTSGRGGRGGGSRGGGGGGRSGGRGDVARENQEHRKLIDGVRPDVLYTKASFVHEFYLVTIKMKDL